MDLGYFQVVVLSNLGLGYVEEREDTNLRMMGFGITRGPHLYCECYLVTVELQTTVTGENLSAGTIAAKPEVGRVAVTDLGSWWLLGRDFVAQ